MLDLALESSQQNQPPQLDRTLPGKEAQMETLTLSMLLQLHAGDSDILFICVILSTIILCF